MKARAKLWWKLFQSGEARGILAGLAAHSGQISVGLSQGFSAILIPKLLESKFATQSEASWIASLGVVSNPLGALAAGLSSEWFGRRSALALAVIPHVTGWILIAIAKNVPMLYVGRFISGIGSGMANGLYLYVNETAAPNQRAWLASCGPILVSFGVLMIYTLGAITTWQNAALISIAPAIFSLALVRMLPETPAWLATRGRMDEARQSLLWLRGPGINTEAEHQALCTANTIREQKKNSLLRALNKPNVWKPFLILFLFFAFQQLCGIYVILFYTVNIIEDIGVRLDEYYASVGIGVVRLFASIAGAGLASNFDRKTMACLSGLGMAASAMGVALSICYHVPTWVPLALVGTHVGFSMIGYLTLPWVMTSELYPLRFRGSLGGLTTSIAQILTFVTIKTYPDVKELIGLENTMWAFSGAGIAGALFALTILPETRGRSLDQIENAFSGDSETSSDPETPTSIETDTTIVTRDYAYDNANLDMSLDDPNATNIVNGMSERDIEDRIIQAISYEQVHI